MNQNPLITFCIPTYNRASYLKNCLESVIGYRGGDIEIVISDNCSTDNTREIVKEFSDNRLKYYRNSSNLGPRKNVRLILDYASGDYIFYLTDDDVLIPGAVNRIKEFITSTKVSVFRTAFIVFLEKSGKAKYISSLNRYKQSNVLSLKEKATIINQSSVLSGLCFRKKDFDLSFYDKNIDLWYPSTLITGCLSNNMGYHAKPAVIHTWENEIFWGINDKSKELLISQIKGLALLKDFIEPPVYQSLIKMFMIQKRRTFKDLLVNLSLSDKIKLIIQVIIKRNIKYVTRFLSGLLKGSGVMSILFRFLKPERFNRQTE